MTYLFPIHSSPGVVQSQTHKHTHPGHPVAKQVLARLIPVCELKAMHYLSDRLVLYVRQAAAICALEALVLPSQPGKQAHLHLQRRHRLR